ncbi:methyltransferase domain-containing protein [Alloyangia pacifica]|uniref:Ubiquinone/menaquinone biosynthesis C-methylase UbiE n=1 Tax=Alloyangia pacifica TaxID=311180 RepID=A0A1I6QR42_9RHOB|nr:methyltransferase domain-containing protein [Alloyangia pacifica]SDF96169.1 Ubiquinone/menaquinone biosynthesis C-methylase UbiE [Alloyangia pacifica]SFS54961.1 Ubiquinone/menaquinone biosynthesis C-methylase UbiE [Alloyangia pacifica]
MGVQEEDAATGQIAAEAARVYEKCFVPALFGQFAPWLVEAAGIRGGGRVLDVATGTGIVARAALHRGASVTAVDINEGMLTVARELAPQVSFQRAPAESLPFEDDAFDAVTCQFALMFFADRVQALRDMARVCHPGGHVAVSVFDTWENSPGYRDLIPLLSEVMGAQAAEALKAPFCLGGPGVLEGLLEDAGLGGAQMIHKTGQVRHASLDAWLDTEIGGWTLASLATPEIMATLKAAAAEPLGQYRNSDGTISFEAPAIFAVAQV